MTELIKFLVDSIKNLSFKSFSSLFILFVIIIVLMNFIFPIVQNNYLNYFNLERKTEILKILGEIPSKRLAEDEALNRAYNQTITELVDLKISSEYKIINIDFTNFKFLNFDNTHNWWQKFVAGSVLSFFFIPFMVFDKNTEEKQKVTNVIVLTILGVLLGLLALIVPIVFGKPFITYIGIPIFQILVIVIISVFMSKTKR